jgi:choline-sulfatase
MSKRNALYSIVYTIVICILLTLGNCGKQSTGPADTIDSTFLWEKNQITVTTANGSVHNWSGFKIEKGFFVPTKTISKFIVWREKEEDVDLYIDYLLKGKFYSVFVNSKKVFKLKRRYKLTHSDSTETGAAPSKLFKTRIRFNRGFNFIEFRKKGKSVFKVKSFAVAAPGRPLKSIGDAGALLSEGEGMSRYFHAGSGTIGFHGKGKIHVKLVDFVGGKKNVQEKDLESNGDTIRYDLNIEKMGFVRVTVETGKFDITELSFKKRSTEKNTGPLQAKLEKLVKGASKPKPNIYILLIDGCHAEHIGVYGYNRDTSPNVDRFAKDAVLFENAYANATFTRSSVASIFTGFHPHRHKLRVLTNKLPKGLFMMPEFMKKKGYRTSILTEAGNIARTYGFAQGVDNYQKVFRRWDDPRYLENNMFKFFTESLEESKPQFTYIHYRAPHFPIVPPPPYLDMYKEKKLGKDADRLIYSLVKLGNERHQFTPEEIHDVINDYDSSINYVDAEVGKVLEALKKKGLYDSSIIIFTSDHGEAMFEHGYWGHGHNVYDEAARVPLIVKFPTELGITGKVERLVQLVDIFPMFASMMGETRYFDGESLLESVEKHEKDDRFVFSTSFGMPPSIGIRWRSWYYIIHLYNNSEELFNLEDDPLKSIAALPENEDMVMFFRSKFLSWYVQFDSLERSSQSIDLKKLPKDEYDNLKSLGYIN